MRLERPRRRHRSAVAIGCAAVLAGALGVWAAIGLPASEPGTAVASDAASAVPEGAEAEQISTETGAAEMMVSDVMIPGPAAELGVESPNRLGSEQVPVRRYEPETEAWATLVWAHGGSFVHGDLDWPEAHWVSQRFADAGVRVYSVDYGLASESVKAPAPANDVAAVLREVAALTSEPLVLGGASAGANLAVQAALTHAAHAASDSPDAAPTPLAGLLLEYPTLHRVQEPDEVIAGLTASLPERRQFGAVRVADMYDFYLAEDLGSAAEVESPAGYPLLPVVVGELSAAELAPLPPTVIVNAEADDLRASGEQFAQQLRDAGVAVSEYTQPGTIHGYLNRPDESDQALVDAEQTVARFVEEMRVMVQGAGSDPA